MNNRDVMPMYERGNFSFSTRDLLAIAFRRKRIAAVCFFGILTGAVLAAMLQPAEYRATTKFLVDRERLDPVISPEQNVPIAQSGQVSEEELNSEVGLIQDNDVLRQVVVSCGLDKRKAMSEYIFGPASPEKKIAKATSRLAADLQIEPAKKSNLIGVSYTSTDPQLAARVLQVLGDAYIQKHVAVHTPPGQVQFFDEETERYKKNLSDAETQLKQFSEQEDGVAPQVTQGNDSAKIERVSLQLAADPSGNGRDRATNQNPGKASRNYPRAAHDFEATTGRRSGSAGTQDHFDATGT